MLVIVATMGAEMVARSAPDGYTVLLASASTHVFAVHLSKNIRYDPIRDFTPITLLDHLRDKCHQDR